MQLDKGNLQSEIVAMTQFLISNSEYSILFHLRPEYYPHAKIILIKSNNINLMVALKNNFKT